MSRARHRGTRRAPLKSRASKLARPAGVAACVTGLAVAAGLSQLPSGAENATALDAGQTAMQFQAGAAGARVARDARVSRDRSVSPSRTARRVTLEPQPVAHRWATADLNIWTEATDESKRLGLLESGSKVAVTGQVVAGWAEVLLRGKVRYVNAEYLTDDKPEPEVEEEEAEEESTTTESEEPAPAGISTAPCPDGSAIESGLTSRAIAMYRAVCAAFPALTTYGGRDPHGEHADGRAIDFMTSDQALGDAIAEFLQANAAELGIRDIIWRQRIWTPERAGEGWRWMPSRGSATADHYDHVHAAVY